MKTYTSSSLQLLLALGLATAPITAANGAVHHEQADARAGDVRVFALDMGVVIRLTDSHFFLQTTQGATVPLSIDQVHSAGTKVSLLIPASQRGAVKLSWNIVTVDGETNEGVIGLNLL